MKAAPKYSVNTITTIQNPRSTWATDRPCRSRLMNQAPKYPAGMAQRVAH